MAEYRLPESSQALHEALIAFQSNCIRLIRESQEAAEKLKLCEPDPSEFPSNTPTKTNDSTVQRLVGQEQAPRTIDSRPEWERREFGYPQILDAILTCLNRHWQSLDQAAETALNGIDAETNNTLGNLIDCGFRPFVRGTMDDLNKWIRWTKPVGGRTDANLNVHLRTIREGDFSSVETVADRLGKAIDAIWKTRAPKETPVGDEVGANPTKKKKGRPILRTNERKAMVRDELEKLRKIKGKPRLTAREKLKHFTGLAGFEFLADGLEDDKTRDPSDFSDTLDLYLKP